MFGTSPPPGWLTESSPSAGNPKSFPRSDSSAPRPSSGHEHVPSPSPGERPHASSYPAAFRLLDPPCSAHSQTRASLSLPHRQTCGGLSEFLANSRHQQPTQNTPSTFMPSLKAGWSLRTAAPSCTQRVCSVHPPQKQNPRGQGRCPWAPSLPHVALSKPSEDWPLQPPAFHPAQNIPATDQGLQLQDQLLPLLTTCHCHHPCA